ncbi:TPA: AAA family ATPase [Pseudomonas aeruginosa]
MRITKLEITNFQGLRHAALDVSAPVLLVAGHNGAGKSSLLDAISHAFTGKPGRVAQKQHIGQLITEGAKKGEARVEWLDESGEVQVCGVALPSGKGSPLADSPFLPFVLDASRFAALDTKDRRRVLFDLTGASAPNDGTAALLVSLAWPWDEQWWKPTSARRDLVKACALALAEIERLDRAAASQGGPSDA